MKRLARFAWRLRRWLAAVALAFAALVAWVVLTPFPDELLRREAVTPLVFLDRDGHVLREDAAPDGRHGRWTPLREISPWLVEATLVAEDRRFRSHAGVDPLAVLRAAKDDALAGRRVSGASTITMQLVRLLRPRKATWAWKAEQAVLAVRLERRLSKDDILEEYLNRSPYAGNIAGVAAASRLLLGKSPGDLSPAEAALLAGLPQSPGRLDPRRHPEAAQKRQRWILDEMKRLGRLDGAQWERAVEEKVDVRREPSRLEALDFTEWVRRPGDATVRTTLDAELQRDVEAILRAHRDVLEAAGASEAAVVVLDNATGEVRAFAGPASRRRSPGSTLKPFVYGLALEDGATAATVYDDRAIELGAPAGPWLPRNYDGVFHGRVSLRDALANSLNIPAVLALKDAGLPRALSLLRSAGLAGLDPHAQGLGLVLGDARVSPVELAGAYAALARGGTFVPPRGRGEALPEKTLLSPDTAWLLGDILSDDATRSLSFGTATELALDPPVAAKTGTSAEHRDNWVAGFSSRFTVVVWAGNPDGRPLRGTCGLEGAGPIFRAVMLRLGPAPLPSAPATVRRAEVCADCGGVPGPDSPRTRLEWIPRGRPLPECAAPRPAFRLAFPRDGDVFVDEAAPGTRSHFLVFRAEAPAGARVAWELDGVPLPSSTAEVEWAVQPGHHTLAASCGGESAVSAFDVKR